MTKIETFIFAFLTCLTGYCNDNTLLLQEIREICNDVPQGTYTLSVVRKEFALDDSNRRNLRNHFWFSPNTYILQQNKTKSDERTDDRMLDYCCLINSERGVNFSNILSHHSQEKPYTFESEQTIDGYVKSTFKKVDSFVLKVFVPSTGEMQDLNVPGNRFHLNGLDFVDGTVFTLQAVSNKGNDKSLQLYIDSLQYPKVSVKNYHFPFVNTNHVETVKQSNPSGFITPKIPGAIELPEVVAKGRRIKPMNRLKFDPDRAMDENDHLFEIAHTMDMVVARFGLYKGCGYVKAESDDEDQFLVEAFGRRVRKDFVVCEVMLDGELLRGYELEDIPYMNPLDIKQMEYFLPSNYELFGNLAGNGGTNGPIRGLYGEASSRGLLMIWTKSPTAFSYFKHRKPLSTATVKQLGYMPPKQCNNSGYSPNSPTIYWNPWFNPQEFRKEDIENIVLNEGTKYIIKIEGISDKGKLVSKQQNFSL